MKLSVVADLIEEFYYNGRINNSAKKLEFEDFFELGKASASEILRNAFYNNIQLDGESNSFLSSMVSIVPMRVTKDELGRYMVDGKVQQLPRNGGIFNIFPIIEECGEEIIDFDSPFSPIIPGTEWRFTKKRLADLGIDAYTVEMDKPILYQRLSYDKVAVQGIHVDMDGDTELPDFIAKMVFKDILGEALNVVGFPIKMRADDDPNPQTPVDKINNVNR